MTASDWQPLGQISPRELGKARHLAHNGAQWLARIARSYVEPDEDDSHASLSWEHDGQALVTREIAPGLVLELRVPDLVLQFKEDGERVSHQLDMDDRSPAQVEAWLLVELLHRGVDRDRLSKDLPYKLPGLMTGDAVNYYREPAKDELLELSRWYANGAFALGRVRENFTPPDADPSPVRCWPHRFNMDVLFQGQGGEEDQSIRIGMAPGDGYYGEPYFYAAPAPHAADDDLPPLPEFGHWHRKDFVAAVVTGSRIVEKDISGDEIVEFLGAVIPAKQ